MLFTTYIVYKELNIELSRLISIGVILSQRDMLARVGLQTWRSLSRNGVATCCHLVRIPNVEPSRSILPSPTPTSAISTLRRHFSDDVKPPKTEEPDKTAPG